MNKGRTVSKKINLGAGGLVKDDVRWCNHSTYLTANPDCPVCVGMYGHIPDSPAFQGSRLEKALLLAARWLKRRRTGGN